MRIRITIRRNFLVPAKCKAQETDRYQNSSADHKPMRQFGRRKHLFALGPQPACGVAGCGMAASYCASWAWISLVLSCPDVRAIRKQIGSKPYSHRVACDLAIECGINHLGPP